MITATIDKSVLLSNLEVQRNSEFEHVHQRKEKELNETAWSLFVATEALRDILVDGGRRTWGELSPKQVTALWIGAASSIGAVGLGLDWGRKWLLLPLAAAVFRAPSDHRAVVFALCFAAILLGLELFILKGTQIDADGNIAVADKEPAIPNVFSTLHSPTLSWASVPLLPGTLGMLSGGGFRNGSEVTLVAQDGTEHATPALDASTAALKFKMPDVPGAYDVRVDGSAPLPVNVPDIWWWQGDAGDASTPGGWLRVFGRALTSVADPAAAWPHPDAEDAEDEDAEGAAQASRAQLEAAVARGDFAQARAALGVLERQQHRRAAMAAPPTTLRLVAARGGAELRLSAVNATAYHASFELPPSLAPGAYVAHLSNGLSTPLHDGWSALRMFASPAAPNASLVHVTPPRRWSDATFTVDCGWSLPLEQRSCGWAGARSSAAVERALEAARAAGGGIVYLPRGQYFVDGPLIVPEGTRLRGEGAALVAIYFREDGLHTSPRHGYIHSNNSAAAWAVEDLTLYVTHHYVTVIYVHPATRDFTLQRVRVRAVAWAFLGDPVSGATGRGARSVDFSASDLGPVVYLDGCNNYRIVDNDLLGTSTLISTGSNQPGVAQLGGGLATNGIIARNTLWNANAAHWLDSVKQVIFEWNTVRPGGAEVSWGSNLDNYSPGYCQHVYHAHNHFQHVYAGDREAMTTDPVTGDYFGGALVGSSGGGVELTLRDGIGAADPSNVGGAVSVLDGTGAGQYRRVVHVSNGTSLRLDAAFDTPLDSTSRVQVGRFKGRFLFWANTYEDCGGFQFYANVVDGVVARHRFVRAEALLSWGRATSSAGHVYAPNLRVQFTENTVVEGNHLWNWNGSYPYPHPKTVEPYFIGVLGSDQDSQPCEPYPHGAKGPCTPSAPAAWQGPINQLVVIQRNRVLNNGGVVVRGHTANVLVEANVMLNSSVQRVHVNRTHASNVLVAEG